MVSKVRFTVIPQQLYLHVHVTAIIKYISDSEVFSSTFDITITCYWCLLLKAPLHVHVRIRILMCVMFFTLEIAHVYESPIISPIFLHVCVLHTCVRLHLHILEYVHLPAIRHVRPTATQVSSPLTYLTSVVKWLPLVSTMSTGNSLNFGVVGCVTTTAPPWRRGVFSTSVHVHKSEKERSGRREVKEDEGGRRRTILCMHETEIKLILLHVRPAVNYRYMYFHVLYFLLVLCPFLLLVPPSVPYTTITTIISLVTQHQTLPSLCPIITFSKI